MTKVWLFRLKEVLFDNPVIIDTVEINELLNEL
jgi:hypothetical protein